MRLVMSKAAVDLKFRSEGRCRLCLRPNHVRKLTRHRIVPGTLRGVYTPSNCVPLCRPCHELVDHWDRSIRTLARKMLRASLWPVEVGYAAARLPDFDVRYPRSSRDLVEARRLPASNDDTSSGTSMANLRVAERALEDVEQVFFQALNRKAIRSMS